MRLVDVYSENVSEAVLYWLMFERPQESFISHQKLPTQEQHAAFVRGRPFRYWYLLQEMETYVGAIECTDRNEVGVAVFKTHQRKGCAREALKLFFATHEPLPAIPAVRNGNWLANIRIDNESSKAFFRSIGFSPLQETWVQQK